MPSETLHLKNRMREIRSYGSVGGLGHEAQVYPEDRGRWLVRITLEERTIPIPIPIPTPVGLWAQPALESGNGATLNPLQLGWERQAIQAARENAVAAHLDASVPDQVRFFP